VFWLTRCLILTLLSHPAWAQGVPRLPVEAFATPPHHTNVRISPNGRYIAAKRVLQGKYVLIVYDLEHIADKEPFIVATENEEVAWLEWANEDRLIVSIHFTAYRFGTPTVETRLVAVNADGSEPELLVKPKRTGKSDFVKVAQIQDRVVDYLYDDPENILMSFNVNDPLRPRLYKVNIYNGRKKTIETGRKDVATWYVDQQARARIYKMIDDTNIRYFHRAPGARDWELIREYEATGTDVFSPILFDKDDPNILYVYSNHEGNTIGVYRYDTLKKEFFSEMFRHDDVDVSGVYTDPKHTEIIGVALAFDSIDIYWLSNTEKDILVAAQKHLPGRKLSISSKSENYERVIIYASAPSTPGRYYLYTPADDKLQYFAFTYPELDKAPMSEMSAVTYNARDGLEIPAYLSIPPGVANPPAEPIPAIVFPHGGPWTRDVAQFDPWVQLLTNRGYAVLQMNFRGSAGFGREFLNSGFKQWGQAMQDDVTDGTRWLIEQGVADPEKICIYGGSYGGYAALMGAVLESELYRCAVSLNGVSDLTGLIERERRYQFWEARVAWIGDFWADRAELGENSPVNHADQIAIPVLLAHGTDDRTVAIRQSDTMASAMKKAGVDYRYLRIDGADHGLTREPHRLEFFRALDDFLAEHLQ
jgi:dipeptidyl aminopeptidase/acylaminoacyl peptidase